MVLLECAICSHTLLALFKVSHALSYTNLRNQSEDKRPIVSTGSNLVTLKFVFHHSKIVVLPQEFVNVFSLRSKYIKENSVYEEKYIHKLRS